METKERRRKHYKNMVAKGDQHPRRKLQHISKRNRRLSDGRPHN